MPNWTIEVSGESHDNADGSSRQDELAQCKVGEPVRFAPEPTNAFDADAVAIFSSRGVQIGYIPRTYKAIRRRVVSGNPVTGVISSIGSGAKGIIGVEVKVSDTGPPVPDAPSSRPRGAAKGSAGCLVLIAIVPLMATAMLLHS